MYIINGSMVYGSLTIITVAVQVKKIKKKLKDTLLCMFDMCTFHMCMSDEMRLTVILFDKQQLQLIENLYNLSDIHKI